MNLNHLWRGWIEISKKIGNFNILLIFTLIYYVLLWIPGFYIRFFTDPLGIKKNKLRSNFSPWKYNDDLKQSEKSY